MSQSNFHYVMSQLLGTMGMTTDDAQTDGQNDVYTVTLEDWLSVHLVSARRTTLWSFPGKLPANSDSNALLALLPINAITPGLARRFRSAWTRRPARCKCGRGSRWPTWAPKN